MHIANKALAAADVLMEEKEEKGGPVWADADLTVRVRPTVAGEERERRGGDFISASGKR